MQTPEHQAVMRAWKLQWDTTEIYLVAVIARHLFKAPH